MNSFTKGIITGAAMLIAFLVLSASTNNTSNGRYTFDYRADAKAEVSYIFDTKNGVGYKRIWVNDKDIKYQSFSYQDFAKNWKKKQEEFKKQINKKLKKRK